MSALYVCYSSWISTNDLHDYFFAMSAEAIRFDDRGAPTVSSNTYSDHLQHRASRWKFHITVHVCMPVYFRYLRLVDVGHWRRKPEIRRQVPIPESDLFLNNHAYINGYRRRNSSCKCHSWDLLGCKQRKWRHRRASFETNSGEKTHFFSKIAVQQFWGCLRRHNRKQLSQQNYLF